MTRRFPSSQCLPLLLAVLVACGGQGTNEGGVQPTGTLAVAATGLPDGYTAAFAVLRDGAPVLSGALSGAEIRSYPGLPYGAYVVRWDPRTTSDSGDSFTYAAAADTTMVADADPPYLVTGEYAVTSAGFVVIASGGPAGAAAGFTGSRLGSDTVLNGVATVGVPARFSNLRPGHYTITFRRSNAVVDGLVRQVYSTDTLIFQAVASPVMARDTVQLLPYDGFVRLVVLGLPPLVHARASFVEVNDLWRVDQAIPAGPYDLGFQDSGTVYASWAPVTVGDTTWVPTFNAGPYDIAPSFSRLATDTIRYVAQ